MRQYFLLCRLIRKLTLRRDIDCSYNQQHSRKMNSNHVLFWSVCSRYINLNSNSKSTQEALKKTALVLFLHVWILHQKQWLRAVLHLQFFSGWCETFFQNNAWKKTVKMFLHDHTFLLWGDMISKQTWTQMTRHIKNPHSLVSLIYFWF